MQIGELKDGGWGVTVAFRERVQGKEQYNLGLAKRGNIPNTNLAGNSERQQNRGTPSGSRTLGTRKHTV